MISTIPTSDGPAGARWRGFGPRAWNAAFLLVTGLAAAVLWWWRIEAYVPVAVMGAPAMAGLLIGGARAFPLRVAGLVLWAAASGFAVALTGGLAGPLAVWSLSPLAAASIHADRRDLAAGGALSAMVAGFMAMIQSAGLAYPAPAASESALLAGVAVAITGLGLAAGLIASGAKRAFIRRAEISDLRRWAAESRRLDALVESQPLMLLTLDDAGGVREVNGPVIDGLDPKALRTSGLAPLVHEPDREKVEAALASAVLDGVAEVSFAPLHAPDRVLNTQIRRTATGVLVAAVRDETRQHAREAALEQARRDAEALNASKSRFLANMSHELRTPLNAIIGFSDVMRTGMFGPLSPKYAEYAGMIHESGGHLLDLINDVLDMSKIEAEKFELHREEFDAREAVSAALRLMRLQADDAGIQLRGILPNEAIDVDADRRALKQIVINLVSNALKFTGKAGQVTVTLQAHAGNAELTVADTGMGISSEDLERLGRPYEQAGEAQQRLRGTGLGLSLVRAFAELHGGSMAIESTLGEGTAVTVRLPVLTETRTAPEPAPEPPIGPHAGNVIAFDPRR